MNFTGFIYHMKTTLLMYHIYIVLYTYRSIIFKMLFSSDLYLQFVRYIQRNSFIFIFENPLPFLRNFLYLLCHLKGYNRGSLIIKNSDLAKCPLGIYSTVKNISCVSEKRINRHFHAKDFCTVCYC